MKHVHVTAAFEFAKRVCPSLLVKLLTTQILAYALIVSHLTCCHLCDLYMSTCLVVVKFELSQVLQ